MLYFYPKKGLKDLPAIWSWFLINCCISTWHSWEDGWNNSGRSPFLVWTRGYRYHGTWSHTRPPLIGLDKHVTIKYWKSRAGECECVWKLCLNCGSLIQWNTIKMKKSANGNVIGVIWFLSNFAAQTHLLVQNSPIWHLTYQTSVPASILLASAITEQQKEAGLEGSVKVWKPGWHGLPDDYLSDVSAVTWPSFSLACFFEILNHKDRFKNKEVN